MNKQLSAIEFFPLDRRTSDRRRASEYLKNSKVSTNGLVIDKRARKNDKRDNLRNDRFASLYEKCRQAVSEKCYELAKTIAKEMIAINFELGNLYLIQVYLNEIIDYNNNLKERSISNLGEDDLIRAKLDSATTIVKRVKDRGFESHVEIENLLYQTYYDFLIKRGAFLDSIQYATALVENNAPNALSLLSNSFRLVENLPDEVGQPSDDYQNTLNSLIKIGAPLSSIKESAKELMLLGSRSGHEALKKCLINELKTTLESTIKDFFIFNKASEAYEEALKWGCEIPDDLNSQYKYLGLQKQRYDIIANEIKPLLDDKLLKEAVRLNFISYLRDKKVSVIKQNVKTAIVNSTLDKIFRIFFKHKLVKVDDKQFEVRSAEVNMFYSHLFANGPKV
jgi:hypothetical protein